MSRPAGRVGRSVPGIHGLMATSQPLASQAGLAVLQAGGNAVDAAVTAAATLSVVEPTMTGLGGDLFALVHTSTGTLHALNASGRSPGLASLDRLPDQGVPADGPLSVTVPGAVDGWHQLLRSHGSLTLSDALAPAITYARSGFSVTEVVARQWQEAEALLGGFPDAAATFLPEGHAPRAGDRFANPRLGATLERVARRGPGEFYEGETAAHIARAVQAAGGWLTETDLREHVSNWVTPLRIDFLGYEVLELPPNTQGVTALEIFNLIEPHLDPSLGHNSARYCHVLLEATRLAFADRDAYLADPDFVPPDLVELLTSKGYADRRRRQIDPERAAASYAPARPRSPGGAGAPGPSTLPGDTVYLTAADASGTVVSLIQSLFGTFGSGLVAEDTGIVLQNRGALFSSEVSHPNRLGPSKRPFHTLIPAMVLKDGAPWLSYGVMGGDMQAQGHVQLLVNLLVFGMGCQEAGEAPRVRWTGEGVAVEDGVPPSTARGLEERGHRLVETEGFGGFQGIQFDTETGTMRGGSDPRKDGCALGY